jgi:hypothetical protein
VVALAQVRHKAPIHFGWFAERDIQRAFTRNANRRRYYCPQTSTFKANDPLYLCLLPRIEKVISCSHFECKDPNIILQLVRNRQSNGALVLGDP